jgi:uncharacterized cupin superfamily protein
MTRRHDNVVNPDELTSSEGPRRGSYASTQWSLGRSAGGKDLGCTLYEVQPGKIAFPYHWHGGIEEALIVISGVGTLRLGGSEVAVRAGDYIAMPVGAGHAHQLRNTGTEPLRYYAVSTKKDPEVVGYPDSKKVALSTGHGPNGPLRALFHEETAVDYFDRDPLAAPSGNAE